MTLMLWLMVIRISEAISWRREASVLLCKLQYYHDNEFSLANLSLQYCYVIDDAEHRRFERESFPAFVGKCIDLNEFPQYVREYDRGNDVELWQIKRSENES